MGTDFEFSAPQWEAISAPLEPAVVIAGAGSGKTSVMAARVVYLVATGQVAPDQVLGLTFTTKATAELASRVRSALAAAGLDEPASPATATRRAARAGGAGGLDLQRLRRLAAHRARAAHRPRAGHPGDGRRLPLPGGGAGDRAAHRRGRAAQRAPEVRHRLPARPRRRAERAPRHASRRCAPGRPGERPLFEAALATSRAKTEITKVLDKMSEREEILDLVEGYRRLKAQFGLMDFSDQIALAAELARDQPEVGRARAREVPHRAARRVPGHLRRAGPAAQRPVLRRAGGRAGTRR